jgi:hypothetical protein
LPRQAESRNDRRSNSRRSGSLDERPAVRPRAIGQQVEQVPRATAVSELFGPDEGRGVTRVGRKELRQRRSLCLRDPTVPPLVEHAGSFPDIDLDPVLSAIRMSLPEDDPGVIGEKGRELRMVLEIRAFSGLLVQDVSVPVRAEQDVVVVPAFRIDPRRGPQIVRHDAERKVEAFGEMRQRLPRDVEPGGEVLAPSVGRYVEGFGTEHAIPVGTHDPRGGRKIAEAGGDDSVVRLPLGLAEVRPILARRRQALRPQLDQEARVAVLIDAVEQDAVVFVGRCGVLVAFTVADLDAEDVGSPINGVSSD